MTGRDQRFHDWLAEQAPHRAPAGFLDRLIAEVESVPQEGRPTRPMLRFAGFGLAAAACMVVLVAIGLSVLSRPPVVAPAPSVTQSTPTATTNASPSAVPTPQVPLAEAIARIPLPDPDIQTVMPEQVAVTDSAIWSAGVSGSELVQVSTASNRVVTDAPVEYPRLVAGDGQVWALSPWGVAPGPKTVTLSRLDPETGKPILLAEVPYADRLAVGAGGIWLGGGADGDLRLLDAETGKLLRRLPVEHVDISVACGSLWTWNLRGEAWTLTRIDPESGKTLDTHSIDGDDRQLVEIDGECYAYGRHSISHIRPNSVTQTVKLVAAGTLYVTQGSAWLLHDDTVRQVDPITGAPFDQSWRLPSEDLKIVNSKVGADYRLLTADGSLWLLRNDALIRYAIPAP
jgi:outer membrane protein assembly factor BamB